RAETALVVVCRPARLAGLLGRGAPQHIAGGARLERAPHVFAVGVHRQHDHPASGIALQDGARRVRAVQLGHRQVHQHHVGLQVARALHRLAAIADTSHHLHVGLGFDQVLEALGHHAVVVGDENLDGHGYLRTLARTIVPSPGALSTSSRPPAASARSRIVFMPQRLPRAAAAGSKPAPSSATRMTISSASPASAMRTCFAPACLATLLSASCAMRNSATAASGRRSAAASSPSRNTTAMPVRRENSSAYQPSAAPSPYSSSSGGRSSAITLAIDRSVAAHSDTEASTAPRTG